MTQFEELPSISQKVEKARGQKVLHAVSRAAKGKKRSRSRTSPAVRSHPYPHLGALHPQSSPETLGKVL